MWRYTRAARACAVITLVSLFPTAAGAQEDDEPIPYPDQESDERPTDQRGLRELEPTSPETVTPRRSASEDEEEVESLAHLDRPDIGIGLSAVAGTLLLESPAGGLDPRFAWGARFTWEFGRLFSQAPFSDALFADVGWVYAAQRGGTSRVFTDTHYHSFTVAPAWELDIGKGDTWGVFGQLGGGVSYLYSGLHSDGTELTIAALKPLFQYGVGFRGRPSIHPEQKVRLSFRIEVTRFRRGYLDDTLVAASVGGAF